jgi:hypothetical protein
VTRRPPALSTTSIGSLPHTQRELAIQRALLLDIPAMPQLPKRDPAEFMIPQSLWGLPGLTFDEQGEAVVDMAVWKMGSHDLATKLRAVLEKPGERWEPGREAWSTWREFLWEVGDRKLPYAKVQSAGPLTVRWVTRTLEGEPISAVPGLGRQALELILARLLSMARYLSDVGAQPIVFLDEPGLFALNPRDPGHRVSLEELRVVIRALRDEGSLVGIHCCSNTQWKAIFEIGCDYLSVDTRMSLESVVGARGFDRFISSGAGLSLGIIPTDRDFGSYSVAQCVSAAFATLGKHEAAGGVPAKQVLAQSIISPACGLGLRTIPESERVFADLGEAKELLIAGAG